jgi:hypothetical protein
MIGSCLQNENMKTTFKDWPKILRKLGAMKDLSLKEKVLLAQGLAATPEERMKMHDDQLRSLGLYSHWDRKKLGFKW